MKPSVTKSWILILALLSLLLNASGVTSVYAVTVLPNVNASSAGSLRKVIAGTVVDEAIAFGPDLSSRTNRLASTKTVTNTSDSGVGSLRQAISTATAGDTINFAASLSGGTIQLASMLTLTKTLTIDGSSLSSSITLSGDTNGDGTPDVRVFSVNSGVAVTLNSLTISKGFGSGSNGGGISNSGTLTITNSTIVSNTATGSGGGIYNSGTLLIANSTIVSNTATGNGGGIYISGTVTIKNVTIASNGAGTGGGINNASGAILNYANTIVAHSTSGGDCSNAGSIGTNTKNLVEDGTCSASLSGDPKLGPLADNGGSTQTMALLATSPAINAGDNTICAASPVNNFDQRSTTRPEGAICDIGAYELVDNTAPDTSITAQPPNPSGGTSASFSFTGSDNGSGVRSFECQMDGGGFTVCSSPQNYTSLSNGSHTFQVHAIDYVGNIGAAVPYTWTIDTTPLGVTVNQAAGQPDPTGISPINFTAVFSKPINTSTFTFSDVTLGGTALGALTVVISETAPNNGTTFNLAVGGMTGVGTVTASIDAGTVQDLAGNTNTPSTSVDNSVYYCLGVASVTSTSDSGDGSLRQAIADICSGGTITFDNNLSGETIYLSSTLILSKAVTIDGSSLPVPLTLSGDSDINGTPDVRVFSVTVGVPATLNRLIVTLGHDNDNGGGIYNNGVLTVINSVLSNNSANSGGGIFSNYGSVLTVISSTLSDNSASARGGGLFAYGPVALGNTVFTSNTATSAQGGGAYFDNTATVNGGVFKLNSAPNTTTGHGGGLYANTTLNLSGTQFLTNTAGACGGVYGGGATTVNAGVFRGNSATSGSGGGVCAPSTLVVNGTQLLANRAFSGYGGGVYMLYGAVMATLINTTFMSNTAANGGGLFAFSAATLANTTFMSNTATTGSGGGAYFGGTTTVNGGLFEFNQAPNAMIGDGGGAYASSALNLNGVQFLANTAGTNGGGVYLAGTTGAVTEQFINVLFAANSAGAEGEAVYAEHHLGNDTLTILHTTIASPTQASGSAVVVLAGTAHITNTLVASYDHSLDNAGGTISEDYNLFNTSTAEPYSGTIDSPVPGHTIFDPAMFLDPETGNYRLNVGSAAIDTGMNVGVSVDLDGTPRPQNNGYDIGAYEARITKLIIGIVGGGSGVVTPTVGVHPYLFGDTVTLQATANSGSIFTRWDGDPDCGDSLVTMDADKTCNAMFVLDTYTLTIATAGPGSGVVTPTVGAHTYSYSTTVSLQATPNYGSTFVGWSGSTGCNTGIVTVDANKTCIATFALATYTLTVATAGAGSGVVSPTVGAHSYVTGTNVTVEAIPNSGSTFDGWSGACNGTGSCVIPMNAAKAVTATFELNPPVGLSATSDSPTAWGSATTLTATVTGANITFTWNFGDGNLGMGATVTHTYALTATYTAIVTATNSSGSLTATTTVRVIARPVAQAGLDQAVRTGYSVTLNGNASSDPSNYLPLTYHWQQTGGPAVTLSNANNVTVTFTSPLVAQTTLLTFELTTVNSQSIASLPDVVVITVEPYRCMLPLVLK